ncbi:hypothetical protein J3458_014305 [Metarhizium acridum]|uniref:Uncharacterized protein n=1 Tax=Metarhizium acridum (strain CQMa 102) TaxID=655827 RepID=E9EGW1_METAQ|nr:uncharacterized protein MAC_09109 [Metarhizium acridum CQMa 102]EFY84857.1 hypothetical protein MAC_09109 [Metarhizium acridum CQMa 102]KAG8412595.1 hypothetical protein J3458_014305 [Metarhizium acridum]
MPPFDPNTSHPYTMPQWIISMQDYPEFKIINRLVQEPDSTVRDALEEFQRLTLSLIDARNQNLFDLHPWHTFCCLFEVAKRTDHDKQDKLVDFAIGLQRVTVTNPATGEQPRQDGQLLWTEMPALGYTAADDWHQIDVTDANTVPEALERYENFLALLARLSSAFDVDYSDFRVPEMDFSFWSMRAFKEAFEEQPPADSAVRTACMWLIYASDRLWSNIVHGRVFGRIDDDPGTVMTQDMWTGWEQGLRRVRETCALRTIGLVDRAISSMRLARRLPLVNGST